MTMMTKKTTTATRSERAFICFNNRKNYKHRLMDYNNDPTTTFADIQKFFRLLEDRITMRLTEESQGCNK
jgi:hypothetical protein